MSGLRARLASEGLRGPFLGIPSPMVVEIVCGSGPDFVCLDGEHSALRGEMLTGMIRAADLAQVPVLVRVPGPSETLIAEVLDAGATGVLVPRISTAEEARTVVAAARFPPHGRRGVGPGRAARYVRDIKGHVARAERETLVGVQLETVEAVENVAEILAVPGIDLALIGPGDLGICLSAVGRSDLSEVIESLVAAAVTAKVACGIFAGSRMEADRWLERLALVIQGSDAMLLTEAADIAFRT